MKSYSNILIMGKRGTGKTYLTTDILFHGIKQANTKTFI